LNIESFLIKTYNTLKHHKTKEKQLYYHIQVVYMIANTLFRNKKFDASIEYLETMHQLMQSNQKKYDNTFKLKYHLLLALNLNYSNQQDKAIELLEKIKIPKHADLESLLDINLSLVMFYIQKSEYKKAHQMFSKFYHTDNYYTEKAGIEWTIKKNLTEIILHIELGNNDLAESRLLSFKRTFFDYLKQIQQERVITYLSFVESYYKNPEVATSETFKNKIEQSFKWIGTEREDIFVMSFYAWLKSKLEHKNLYQTTLELVVKC
jgi:tetratricopeptide (TPR) repeat protein